MRIDTSILLDNEEERHSYLYDVRTVLKDSVRSDVWPHPWGEMINMNVTANVRGRLWSHLWGTVWDSRRTEDLC